MLQPQVAEQFFPERFLRAGDELSRRAGKETLFETRVNTNRVIEAGDRIAGCGERSRGSGGEKFPQQGVQVPMLGTKSVGVFWRELARVRHDPSRVFEIRRRSRASEEVPSGEDGGTGAFGPRGNFMNAIFSCLEIGNWRSGQISRRWIATAVVLTLALSVLTGCHRKGDPAAEAVHELTRAARDRDARAFLDRVAEDFQAADGSRKADVEPRLRQFFAAWESLDVTVRDLKVERSEGAALARFRVDLSGRARKIAGLDGLRPSTSSWQFETRIAPSGSRWRVTWASWSAIP